MSYKERIITDIKEALANNLKTALNDSVKEIMSVLDEHMSYQPNMQPTTATHPSEYHVTDLQGKEYTYNGFFSARVPFLNKEEFKNKCKSFNSARKKDKWPVHFEFNKDNKLWEVYSDDGSIMNEIAGAIENSLNGELVEKDF